MLATSERTRDDVLEFEAEQSGAAVYRGAEADVLGRVAAAVRATDADGAVRLCGDITLIDPALVSTLAQRLEDDGVEYGSTKSSEPSRSA